MIVAYRKPESLDLALKSVDISCDVRVVNVGSCPEIAKVASRYGAEVVATINHGYAAAVNLGSNGIASPIAVFMNDDVVMTPGSLERLVRLTLATHGATLPRIVDKYGNEIGSTLSLPTPGRLLLEWALTPDTSPIRSHSFGLQKWRRPKKIERIDAGTAAVVAVDSNLLHKIPMPEQYFMYWEELDWFWRLSKTETTVLLEPQAVAIHQGGPSDIQPQKSTLLARNAVRCVRATQGRRSAAIAWPIVVLWWTRLMLVDTLLRRSDRRASRLAGLRAAFNAWREV